MISDGDSCARGARHVASPRGFYLAYGFRLTGDWFDGEEVIELPL